MNKEKIKQALKKNQKTIGGVVAVLWIFSSIAGYKAINTPLQSTKSVVDNKITAVTDYSYTANVRQSTIYKDTKLENPEGNIVYKLLDSLVVKINSSLNSEKPVLGEIKSKLSVELTAEELPTPIALLPEEKMYKTALGSTNENSLIKDELTISISDIVKSYLDKIEQDTGYRLSKYNIVVRDQIVDSDISYNGNKLTLNDSSELNFEYSNGQFKRVGEKSFKKETPIKTNVLEAQQLSFAGLKIPILAARWIFLSLWLTLSVMGIFVINKLLDGNGELPSEADQINRRYGNRLIEIEREIRFDSKVAAKVKSFKTLLTLAEDKELVILKFDDSDKVIYYASDNDCIYNYSASKANVSKPTETATIRVGSELVNEK